MAGRPRPLWGWHKLDRKWAERLVAHAHVAPSELVLDVGAGTGVITEILVATGARVIAVELHHGRAQRLEVLFARRVRVVEADAGDLRLPRRPFKVVANPPFAIADRLMRRLVSSGTRLTEGCLILPRPVAHRWAGVAAPGIGRWGAAYVVEMVATVPRRAFVPAPPRDAALVYLRRRRLRGPSEGGRLRS